MSLQFGAFHESLPTFCTHVHARSMCVEVFPHSSIVSEHLTASFMGTRDCSLNTISISTPLQFSLSTKGAGLVHIAVVLELPGELNDGFRIRKVVARNPLGRYLLPTRVLKEIVRFARQFLLLICQRERLC